MRTIKVCDRTTNLQISSNFHQLCLTVHHVQCGDVRRKRSSSDLGVIVIAIVVILEP